MTVSEGGIRTPMLMAGPGVKGDRQVNAFCYVTEIMPTLLELTGVKKPDTYNGERVAPMRGRSLVKVLTGTSDSIYHDDEAIARELGFGMWIRRGDYKAACVPQGYGSGNWELYNFTSDPGETNNLAGENPALLNELKDAWHAYAKDVGVVLPK